MRIEQLEYIQAITRLGSLRRAAEELHLSQPALSETMRNLERELGVEILDRHRSGARISDEGRELLPYIAAVIESVDRLRRAADDQHRSSRVLRLGTVNVGTAAVVVPAIRRFRELHPDTEVEVVGAMHSEIERAVQDGGLDFGLVIQLAGDEVPGRLELTELLPGKAVVCIRPDSPLARHDSINVADLAEEPLVVMRSGYAMHRLVQRILEGRSLARHYSSDGAEMGKLMVAEGLGAALLPDFSVVGDPLERAELITWRPLEGAQADLTLGIVRRGSGRPTRAALDLFDILVELGPRSAKGFPVRQIERAI
jgi:DNA-binding transcriptional LysR family regulator